MSETYTSFAETRFIANVEACIDRIKSIIKNNKEGVPVDLKLPENVHHTYDDKYYLANLLTKITCISILNAFSEIGLNQEVISKLLQWSSQESSSSQINLSFDVIETCSFIKEYKFDVASNTRVETERSIANVIVDKITSREITTVTEYEYIYNVSYKLKCFTGVGDNIDETVILQERTAKQIINIRNKNFPYPETKSNKLDLNITWILGLFKDNVINFQIDRTDQLCYTPAKNKDIDESLSFMDRLDKFCFDVRSHIERIVQVQMTHDKTKQDAKFDYSGIVNEDSSIAISPLFSDSNITISDEIITQLLNEQSRNLSNNLNDVDAKYIQSEDNKSIITNIEYRLILICLTISQYRRKYNSSINYIDSMIRKQFISAIGKIITADDFYDYMNYHLRNLFLIEYQPKPFSFSIRRSTIHSSEGVIRIEKVNSTSKNSNPILTITKFIPSNESNIMNFSINASTKISFGGDRYLHAFQCHSFSNSLNNLQLVCQARQFSSYIVVIGRIVSSTIFDPKYAFILKDKDEITIPLELSQIPTAKEFRDAIESLSPEQQRFAKAYRSMQLDSTLFGICIIQIKPLLEKALNIPFNSLTKEIQLTQDLMTLFIKYQIPTDLLSYDVNANHHEIGRVDSIGDPIQVVRKNVEKILTIINQSKQEEIVEKAMEYKYENPGVNNNRLVRQNEIADQYKLIDDTFDCSVNVEPQSKYFYKQSEKKSSSILGGFANMVSGSSKQALGPLPSSARDGAISRTAPELVARGASSFKRESRQSVNATPQTSMMSVTTPKIATFASYSLESTATSQQASNDLSSSRPLHIVVNIPSNSDLSENDNNNNESSNNNLNVFNGSGDTGTIDFTKYPSLLDSMIDKYDVNSSSRATIITPSSTWSKESQSSLLSSRSKTTMALKEQNNSRDEAFDLLDALSRSGALSLDYVSLHIVIASTHNFDDNIIDTITKKNINPIEKVERSVIVIASAIHGANPSDMIVSSQLPRVQANSPEVLLIDTNN